MDGENIRKRYHRLVSLRQTVNETWDAIERYIAPYRGRFFKDERSENSIEWRKPWVYDSTAIMASQALSAHLHSSLTSPAIQWFDLTFRDEDLNDSREAKEWLDSCGKAVYQALQDSNFNVEAGETYQDLVDFGTSVIVEEVENEGEWKGINFSSIPIKECYFEQDHKGDVYNFYRRLEWSAIQIVEKFGAENVPDWVNEKASEDSPAVEEREVLIFCVYRRPKVDPEVDLSQLTAPIARPYGFKYILEKDATQIGEEGGYYEMPAFVPRWRKTSGSMWGNSPAMICLSDVLTLNRLIEMTIQAAEKVIDPPTLTTERGLIGDLDLNPGGLNVVKDINQIKPYESAARFDISYQEIQRYRDQIKEYFMIDQLMLPPMQGQGNPATATEIAARVSQLERLIGPTLGRLQTDFLDPCISRTFNILFREGQLPEVPEIVLQSATGMDIEYLGPLARSQKQDQVDAVERWLMQVGNIAQLNPEVLDIPDWDELVKGVGQVLGVPAKYIAGDAEIKRTRKERAEAQQRAQEAELARAEGEAAQAQGEGQQAMTGGEPTQ